MDERSFFEYGKISIKSMDYEERYLECEVCIPCCLMQAVSPHLLANGLIDYLRVRDPIAIWVPHLKPHNFVDAVRSEHGLCEKVNSALKEEVLRGAKLFLHLSNYLVDPSDIIPILPLGTYIQFTYRCSVDNVIPLLAGIDTVNVTGVHEFQYAMASVLHEVLEDFQKIGVPKRVLNT